MIAQSLLDEVVGQFRKYKDMVERAVAQVSDEDFFARISPGSTSIAIVLKHLAGNHRSRWRDFLSTDGEKADRHRDEEFLVEGETRASVDAAWKESWEITFGTLGALGPDDLEREITIRGEAHSVVQALERNLNHFAYHAGQVVFLARHFAGDAWKTLSIPPGKSEDFNEVMRQKFGGWS